jgi:hypothetical protein
VQTGDTGTAVSSLQGSSQRACSSSGHGHGPSHRRRASNWHGRMQDCEGERRRHAPRARPTRPTRPRPLHPHMAPWRISKTRQSIPSAAPPPALHPRPAIGAPAGCTQCASRPSLPRCLAASRAEQQAASQAQLRTARQAPACPSVLWVASGGAPGVFAGLHGLSLASIRTPSPPPPPCPSPIACRHNRFCALVGLVMRSRTHARPAHHGHSLPRNDDDDAHVGPRLPTLLP